MPRKSNSQSRRAEIIAAALPVIAQCGYEKATVQAIAKQAQLAPGLIHYHFKNKQEILVSLVHTIADYGDARFLQIAAEASGPGERLRAYLESRLGLGEGASHEMVAAWVMIGAEAVRQAEVREVYQRAVASELARLSALLEECLGEQRKETGGAEALAAGLLAMMVGAFQLSSAARAVIPLGYAVDCAIAFAELSIAAAPLAS
jgi:TetR/AcrR family transcriptional regulator, transcriptional repressor of bet genes